MLEELNISMNINIREKTLYIGEESGAGAVYEYKDVKDLAEQIKFYLDNYYGKEIEKYGDLLKTKEEVDLIYEFLKEQSDTEWIDLEKLKVLQDKKLVLPGNRPTDLMKKLDTLVEKLWDGLEDIPFYEEDSEQFIEEDYLDFKFGTSKEDIWHWFDERHSKGVHHLLYEHEINNEQEKSRKCIYFAEIHERVPLDKRDKELFYYECRTSGDETTVERSVKVDFSETLVTNQEILGDKEYIPIKELFNDSKYIFLDNSDIEEKVLKDIEEELEEEE